ncbi:MAG TPA: hypothetical protein VGC79_31000 [Polyangiaceae bacterium]
MDADCFEGDADQRHEAIRAIAAGAVAAVRAVAHVARAVDLADRQRAGGQRISYGLDDNGDVEESDQFLAIYLRDPSTDAITATLFKTAGSDALIVPSMTPFSVSVVPYRGMTLRLDVFAQVRYDYFPAAFDHFRFQ